MTDLTQQNAEPGPVSSATPDDDDEPINPWGVTLLVIAAALFIGAGLALLAADAALNSGFEPEQGPPRDVLAGIYYQTAAVLGSLGVIAIIVRVGAAAATWRPER